MAEKGLLIGVAASFLVIWYVAVATDIAWPWYCVIGVLVNAVVAYIASLLLTGKQDEMHLYTVKGQQAEYARLNKPIKEDGWYVVPGKIDAPCYGLLVMFVFSLVMLWGINAFTDNAPMLINFMRGCSILVATACIGYMGYSLLSPKRKVAVKQAN